MQNLDENELKDFYENKYQTILSYSQYKKNYINQKNIKNKQKKIKNEKYKNKKINEYFPIKIKYNNNKNNKNPQKLHIDNFNITPKNKNNIIYKTENNSNQNKKILEENSFSFNHSNKWVYKSLSNRKINIAKNNDQFINNNNKDKINNSNSINNNFSRSNISLLTNSSKNDKYLNDIYKTRNYIIENYKGNYSKLDDSLSYDNIYSVKNTNSKEDFFDEFYNNNISFLLEKNMKNKKLYQQKLNDELKECTFKPKLINSTQNLLKIINYPFSKNNDDIYKKNIKWLKNKNKNLLEKKIILEQKKYEQCHFNNISHYNKTCNNSFNKTKNKEQDYIFKKNIKWLNEKKIKIDKIKEKNYKLFKDKDVSKKIKKIINNKNNKPIKIVNNNKNSINKENNEFYKDINNIKNIIDSLKKVLKENKIIINNNK